MTLSAEMILAGSIHEERLENFGPCVIFDVAIVRAMSLVVTSRKEATYSERRLLGRLVVESEFDFTVESCIMHAC